ncbi:PadR family transcriptional regulator [Alicyclobacillus fodiniaquatilis]|uniref:PadR family transcriptional regulator n=1 Tax=Alicyclobacillus fodiniaquatilis TaxID=1661150 RepID=A0ABW4JF76_9BACL
MDVILLSILSEGDSYGYDIVQQVNDLTHGALLLKEGSLYPALKRLEANHFIEGYWGTDKNTGPRRRYYSIKERGRTHLKGLKREWDAEQLVLSMFFRKVIFE